MKNSTLIVVQFVLSVAVGATIACSPTKFANNPTNLCTDANESCVVENGVTKVDQLFKVGAGKVDILFVDDNSASMSRIQSRLAARFGGFVEALDHRQIDYRIAITTTDKSFFTTTGLISFGNGQQILKNTDTNRVSLFNGAIVRQETVNCEQFILSQYYTYGPGFNRLPVYAQQYPQHCPSGDERGIYAAHEVVSKNLAGFVRSDANLNIIVLSNEDVRSGYYNSYPAYALENQDQPANLVSMINTSFPGKHWEFNSIITKSQQCINQQRTESPWVDENGNSIFGFNIGTKYAEISASAATTIDGLAAPRGKILDICQNDYTAHFADIAANISDAARLLTLKCTPMEAPVVTDANGMATSIPYTWNGQNRIVFNRGSEGVQIKVSYRCYTGVM